MAEGYDSLVDRLMYCDGLDRAEAEAEADRRFAKLAADVFACNPCECGGACQDCDPGDCAGCTC